VEVKGLNKFYGAKQVVNEVSFKLPKGKVISLIGPNGAGKSTVLNIMTRLTPQDGGQVLLENKDIKKWNSKELAKKLAILTQSNNISAKLTVGELIAFGRFPYSGNKLTAEDHKQIDMAIEYMELGEYKNRFIDELSGGQRQRAFIAMVIAQDTEFIFLDEPINNLDIYHSANTLKLVRRLCDELGKTVTVVLHDINFASVYSDYIGAFKDGKLFKFDTVDQVITKENLKTLYNVDFDIHNVNGKQISIYY